MDKQTRNYIKMPDKHRVECKLVLCQTCYYIGILTHGFHNKNADKVSHNSRFWNYEQGLHNPTEKLLHVNLSFDCQRTIKE